MESETVDESRLELDRSSNVFEMGRVSEETKGLPHVVQESPGIFPGPRA
jgi:hypothetical protein